MDRRQELDLLKTLLAHRANKFVWQFCLRKSHSKPKGESRMWKEKKRMPRCSGARKRLLSSKGTLTHHKVKLGVK